MTTNVEEQIFMARVAEQSERFRDMVDFLKPVIAEKGSALTQDERNLLSVAFKNLVSQQRTAIRTISAIEQNPKYTKFAGSMGDYKKRIEEELYRNCDDIIQTIRNSVLSKASEDEPRSFFLKMIGDYYRYIAESAKGDRLEKTKNDALSAYQEAQIISEKSLNACNSIRLGLALNFSVFHYEVMQNVTKACELGDKALQDALDRLDDCDEETFRDAQSIIELLRENLSLWKEEGGDNDQQ
jgi:14-3-3 protein epsilon